MGAELTNGRNNNGAELTNGRSRVNQHETRGTTTKKAVALLRTVVARCLFELHCCKHCWHCCERSCAVVLRALCFCFWRLCCCSSAVVVLRALCCCCSVVVVVVAVLLLLSALFECWLLLCSSAVAVAGCCFVRVLAVARFAEYQMTSQPLYPKGVGVMYQESGIWSHKFLHQRIFQL